jgi:cell division protein FtsB
MPRASQGKSKRSAAQKSHLSNVTAIRSGQTSAAASGVGTPATGSGHATPAEEQATSAEVEKLRSETVQAALEAANVQLYNAVRVERRKVQRAHARKHILEGQIKFLKSVELPAAKGDAAKAIHLFGETRGQ